MGFALPGELAYSLNLKVGTFPGLGAAPRRNPCLAIGGESGVPHRAAVSPPRPLIILSMQSFCHPVKSSDLAAAAFGAAFLSVPQNHYNNSTGGATTVNGYLITHAQCLDGATAAVIGLAHGLQPIFVEPDGAGEAVTDLVGRHPQAPIYLADVSIPLAAWLTVQQDITALLDHHVSALALAAEPKTTIVVGRAGSHLLYDYAIERKWIEPSPAWDRLVAVVEAYDLWLPQHEFGQDLARLFRHLGFEWYRTRFDQGWAPFHPDEGRLLARLIQEEAAYVERTLTKVRTLTTAGLRIAGIFLEEEGSINPVAHRLLSTGYNLVVVAKQDGRLSARSDEHVDAARLMAGLFGGGGHMRAAGGRIPQDVERSAAGFTEVLDRIRTYLTIPPGR